jgi:hypothetical protein
MAILPWMPHFHVQWSGTENPDPAFFTAYADAFETADLIAEPDETFTVGRFDGACPVCEKVKIASSSL